MLSERMSQLFNNRWLAKYPRPERIIYDNGLEFKLNFKLLCEEYAIKRKPSAIKNP